MPVTGPQQDAAAEQMIANYYIGTPETSVEQDLIWGAAAEAAANHPLPR